MAKINEMEKINTADNSSALKFESTNRASEFAEKIFNTVREPLLLLDKELRVVKANKSFYNLSKLTTSKTIGRYIYDLRSNQWNIPKMRERLETILLKNKTVVKFEVTIELPSLDKRIMLLNAQKIPEREMEDPMILLIIEDVTEQRHNEESLNEKNRLTKEYLDILLNHAHVPMIIWNSSMLITRINHEFEILSGYEWTELINKKIEILFPNDKVDTTLLLIKSTLCDKKNEVIEIDVLTKDNDIKTVIWNSANVYDKEGKNIVATIAQDITKHKRAEETLKILETRYHRLFESAKDGILILDAETGKIIDVNPFLIELLGYSHEKFIEKEIWEIGFFKDIAANKEKFLELQQKEYVRYENLPLQTSDGRKINVEFVSNVYLVNNHKVIQCNIRDITKRKKAEEALLENERRYRELFNNAPIGYHELDLYGRITRVNSTELNMLGYTSEEMIGQYIWKFVSDEEISRQRVLEKLNGKLSPAKGEEFYYRRKDLTLFPILVEELILRDLSDNIVGIRTTIQDITERKQFEKELITAKEKAEQSDKFKSEFLAQMSHEIRTPLSAIVGNVGYINDIFNKQLDSETSECFYGIDLVSKRIIRTVDLVLNAAELKTSSYNPHFVKVNLDSEILSKLHKEHQQSAKKKGLDFIYVCEVKEKNILADEYSITQIFSNLIDNAIKYTKKGKVEIRLTKNILGNTIVEVKDTGIGINKEFFSRIFEPFTQEEQGYTRSFDGNGLGLALVKNYCNINNALIEVESEKNIGSLFRVVFDKSFTNN